MDDTSRLEALLGEIRDLVKEQRDDARAHLEQSMAITQESVERQRAHLRFYRYVVVAAAVVLVGVFAWAAWMLN